MGRDGESTDRWRQVGEPSGREQGPALDPAKIGNEERRPEVARAPANWYVGYLASGGKYPPGGGKSPAHLQMEESFGRLGTRALARYRAAQHTPQL